MASIAELIREKMQGDGLAARLGVKHLYMAALGLVFLFAFWVRALPASGMQYLQALDPYMIARMSAAIIEQGSLPAVDAWRFFPFTTPTHLLNLGNIYIPAYLFSLVSLVGMDFLTWAQLYPALMGALAVIPMYLLGKEVFDRKTGLLGAFFLSASAAVMQRSSAGWFEKEPVAQLLMLCSMYLFVRAWNRRDWRSGIGSGLFLGVAATSWGGAAMLYLLYPLTVVTFVVGIPLLMMVPTLMFGDGLKEFDTLPGLVAAYVPLALIGSFVPWILNGGTWSISGKLVVLNIGVLGLLAVRHAITKYELIEASRRAYSGIGLFFLGLVAIVLSPLYSQTVYSQAQSVVRTMLQSGGGAVIGGTVAENAPTALNDVVSQLGASMSAAMIPAAQFVSEYFSGWTFGLLGASFLVMALLLMLYRYYYGREEANISFTLGLFSGLVSGISLTLYTAFAVANRNMSVVDVLVGGGQVPGFYASAFVPAIVIASFGTTALFLLEYVYSEEFEQWIGVSLLMWAALFALVAFLQAFEALALLGIVQGIFLMYFRDWAEVKEIEMNWMYVFVLLWIGSTVYGSLQKSRLLFLAAAPVALGAGIGVARVIDAAKRSSVWERLADSIGGTDPVWVFRAAVGLLMILFVAINVATVYVMADGTSVNNRNVGGIGGSPNGAWMENLEYMRDETPPGSVILSWWDYGYWFETIGERPAIADGGNMGYYRSGNNLTNKINLPLADFLTSHNASEWRDWLASYSVDYIVLDSTMIGKYSAVSQISSRDNSEFNQMQTFDCVRQGNRCRVSNIDNTTVIHYQFGRNSDILVPVTRQGDGAQIAGTPIIRTGQREVEVANICQPGRGIVPVHEDEGTTGGFNEALRSAVQQQRPFGGCVTFHPNRGAGQLVMVPPAIMESTLVRLYLMDGAGVDFVEEEFNNGFVKMWKVQE